VVAVFKERADVEFEDFFAAQEKVQQKMLKSTLYRGFVVSVVGR